MYTTFSIFLSIFSVYSEHIRACILSYMDFNSIRHRLELVYFVKPLFTHSSLRSLKFRSPMHIQYYSHRFYPISTQHVETIYLTLSTRIDIFRLQTRPTPSPEPENAHPTKIRRREERWTVSIPCRQDVVPAAKPRLDPSLSCSVMMRSSWENTWSPRIRPTRLLNQGTQVDRRSRSPN